MIKLLKKCHLNITIQTNVKIANFFEVEINLDTDAYQLYRKPDSIPVYINRKSNHHPTTIKKFSKAIAKRIPDISSNEVVFNEPIPIYPDVLRKNVFPWQDYIYHKNH